MAIPGPEVDGLGGSFSEETRTKVHTLTVKMSLCDGYAPRPRRPWEYIPWPAPDLPNQ